MIKVAIVDDHKMFRQGVAMILEDTEDIKVIWTSPDIGQTLDFMKKEQPDVILMDISLGAESGISLTVDLLATYPTLKVLALSMHREDNYIVKMLEVGAKGYLLKDAGEVEILQAIRSVFEGKTYYSNHVTDVLVKQLTQAKPAAHREVKTPLTQREIEILKLIAEEFSNPEIAEKLFISIRTVDTHRRNLLDKINAKNTAGLVKYAIYHKLVEN